MITFLKDKLSNPSVALKKISLPILLIVLICSGFTLHKKFNLSIDKRMKVDTTQLKMYGEGNEYFQNRDYSNAIKIYKNLKDKGFSGSFFSFKLGLSLFRTDNYQDAIVELSTSLNLKPTNIKLNSPFKENGGIYIKAEENYYPVLNYVSLQHKYVDVFFYRGIAKKLNGDNYGAVDDLKKYHSIGKDSTFVSCFYLARSLAGINKFSLAKHYFNYVIKNRASKDIDNEMLSEAYVVRGIANYNLKQKALACLDWSKASELGNSDGTEHIKKYCN